MRRTRKHTFYGGFALENTEQSTTIHLEHFCGSIVIYSCPNGYKFDLDGVEYVSDRVSK